jgi:hypothetical protein
MSTNGLRTQTLPKDENIHLHIALRNPYLDRCVDDVNYIYWFKSTSDTSAQPSTEWFVETLPSHGTLL